MNRARVGSVTEGTYELATRNVVQAGRLRSGQPLD
jgi:hypothetical protein